MKPILFFALIFSLQITAQQDIFYEYKSKVLSETRKINIHLPTSYQKTSKTYPVIYSLDGEYTKLAIQGLVDYYSFWDKIPECIVVSIDQNYNDSIQNKYKRWIDCSYSWKTGLPKNIGVDFKSFINEELIPYIDSSFRTTKFRTIIGHSFTANFINYFLLDDQPKFEAYIAISPYYASNGLDSIQSVIENIKSPIFYYVASGEKDLSGHIQSVKKFNKQFSKVENKHFTYKMFEMKNNKATHYTILPIALPHAVEHIFSYYGIIGEDEFTKILKEKNKVSYLKDRYFNIEQIYGIKLPIRELDVNTVSYAISRKKQWKQLKQIANLTIELFPDSYLGYWTMGEYFEKTKEFNSALQYYETGFDKLGDDVLNKSDFQEDIDRVKKHL